MKEKNKVLVKAVMNLYEDVKRRVLVDSMWPDEFEVNIGV